MQKKALPSKRLIKTAYHEAGHAVAAFFLRLPFRHITIEPEGESLGHVLCDNALGKKTDLHINDALYEMNARVERRIEASVICDFAGLAAEAKYAGRHDWRGAASDFHNSVKYASYVCGCVQEETEAYLKLQRIRAKNMMNVGFQWAAVEALAEALLERRTIGCRTARKIIRKALLDPTA